MSSFGSSVINKSGKKFAPKAVVRRRPGPAAEPDAAPAVSSASQTPVGTPAEPAQPGDPPSAQPSVQPQPRQDAVNNQPVPSAAQTPSGNVTLAPAGPAPTAPEPNRVALAEADLRPGTNLHTDVGEAGERSPKRRRIEATQTAQTISAPTVAPAASPQPAQNAPSAVDVSIARQTTDVGLVVGAESPAATATATPGNNVDSTTGATAQGQPQNGGQPSSSEPANQSSTDATTSATAARTKKAPPQPKAGRRRKAPQLSNQELIREVMGPNSGITKPPREAPSIEEAPEPAEEESAEPSESALADSPVEIAAGEQLQPSGEATGQSHAKKRTSNVAAARRPGKGATTAEENGQAAEEQQEGQSGASEAQSTTGDGQATTDSAQNGAQNAPAKKPRKTRKDKGVSKKRTAAAAQPANEGANGDTQTPAPPKPKRTRKKPTPKTPARVTGDDAENEAADGAVTERPGNGEGSALRKRRRSLSDHLVFDEQDPKNPQKTKINVASMPMGILTQDIAMVGTLTHREEALSKINWDDEKRKRMEERERIALGEEEINTQAERDVALAQIQEAANAANPTAQAPKMRLVNGRMILDSASTQVDRHAQALQDEAELQEVEEDELTTRINQMSWIKANRKDPRERTTWGPTRADRWSDEQTEQFYDALKMFGTDFFIISKMFPGKTRANVKRKFVKEERVDPARIKRVLVGESVPMDFELYKQKTGKSEDFFRDPEALRRELEEENEQRKAEIEEAQTRHQEQMRQRRLAKQGGVEGVEEEGEAGGGKKRKKKGDGKRKKKGTIGGEELEIVEMAGDELDYRRGD